MDSYYEDGNVAYAEIQKGHLVVENQGSINLIYKNTDTTTDVQVETTGEGKVAHAHAKSSTVVDNKDGDTVLNVTFDYDGVDIVSDTTVDHTSGTYNTTDGTWTIAKGEETVVNNAKAQEIVCDFWIDAASDSFAGGTGTEADPYQITNGAELARVVKLVNTSSTNGTYSNSNVYYKLMNNIDLSGKAWTPIGNSSYTFKANFDGNNQEIQNLTNYGKNSSQLDLVLHSFSSGGTGGAYGLFGFISGTGESDNAIVKNIKIVSANINEESFAIVGGIVGKILGGATIENCSVDKDTVISVLKKVGGIVGMIDLSTRSTLTLTIKDCSNAGTITAIGSSTNDTAARASGIIGDFRGWTGKTTHTYTINLENCDNSGTINGYGRVSSLASYIYQVRSCTINVSDCDNTGTLNGTVYVGFISVMDGYDKNDGSGIPCVLTVTDCYDHSEKYTDSNVISYVDSSKCWTITYTEE